MEIEELARSLRGRIPWPVAQTVLKECGLPRSRGWDRTVARLINDASDIDYDESAAVQALAEHQLCGEKNVRFYQLEPNEIDALRNAILASEIVETPFSKAYPAILSDEELEKLKANEIALVAVERTDDGVAAIFASVRILTVREVIEADDLAEEDAVFLRQYSEIVGLKTIRQQATDLVWIPHNGEFIDVRIDFPAGMHHDVAAAAHERLKDLVGIKFAVPALPSPVNLFPIINMMYENAKEGRVVELAFGTTTASLKHEKMRRRSICLRTESYHKGGKAALSAPIEPFRLCVVWPVQTETGTELTPELALLGTSRGTGYVGGAIIRKCRGLADFEHVRARIEHYLDTLP